jgi:hypothetical protein
MNTPTTDMMYHSHNDCMQTYYKQERKTQLGQVSGKAKAEVNYARQTDMPFGNTKAVLGLCAIAAGICFYAGILAGL